MRTGSQSIAISTYLRPTMLSFSSSPSTSAKGGNSNPRRRWLSLAKPALGVALAMGVLTAGQANAVVVNIPAPYDLEFDVTTFTGSYYDNKAKFALPPAGLMPWWKSEINGQLLARLLARWSQDLLGYPNASGQYGPIFAWTFDENNPLVIGVAYDKWPETHSTYLTYTPASDTATWAQVVPAQAPAPSVPGPLPALGAAAAFGFSRKLRKRIKYSTNTSSNLYNS
jgi:hypothetical protein